MSIVVLSCLKFHRCFYEEGIWRIVRNAKTEEQVKSGTYSRGARRQPSDGYDEPVTQSQRIFAFTCFSLNTIMINTFEHTHTYRSPGPSIPPPVRRDLVSQVRQTPLHSLPRSFFRQPHHGRTGRAGGAGLNSHLTHARPLFETSFEAAKTHQKSQGVHSLTVTGWIASSTLVRRIPLTECNKDKTLGDFQPANLLCGGWRERGRGQRLGNSMEHWSCLCTGRLAEVCGNSGWLWCPRWGSSSASACTPVTLRWVHFHHLAIFLITENVHVLKLLWSLTLCSKSVQHNLSVSSCPLFTC